MKQSIGIILGPLLFILFSIVIELDPGNPHVSYMAGIALWMAVWWIFESIPLAATSLLPIVLLPGTGIMNGKTVSSVYFNHIIFLFLGGFLVALAMEKWNLHKRIALKTLLIFGSHPKTILLGFMSVTAFLSMWISNTATTMMMVPIGLAIIYKLEDLFGVDQVKQFSIGLFLGIAYSATIGGIATLVGTPPNLSFVRILQILFPNAPEITFINWFMFAFPISFVFLFITWFGLSAFFAKTIPGQKLDKNIFKKQYHDLGAFRFEEKIVLIHFIALAVLWLTRADIQFTHFSFPGWSNWFSNPSYLNDGTVAIMVALSLFIIPAKNHHSMRLLDWKTASRVPWHIILLFGGGFALATGFKESGLAAWLGNSLSGIGHFHPVVIIIVVCLFVTFLTELTSNTATAEMLLPILGSLAVAIELNPLILMIPATLSCSFAFMLPVATPPNAVIFGSGRIQIRDMIRVGIWLNLIGTILILLGLLFIGTVVFELELSGLPAWAIM